MTLASSGRARRWSVALRLAGGVLALLGCNSMLGIERAELGCGRCAEGTCREGRCVVGGNPDLDAGMGVGAENCDRPGESYCVGRRRLVCGPNRRLARSDDCASPAHCEQAAIAAGESCATCVSTCQGNVLSSCQDGVSVAPTDCGTDFCDTTGGGQCLPAACSAGDVACANGLFLRCDSGMTLSVAATCASPALCNTEQGGCLEAECAPGQSRCTRATLEACSDDRGHWVRSELCASAELCDAAAGVCQPPACSAGDAECMGATLPPNFEIANFDPQSPDFGLSHHTNPANPAASGHAGHFRTPTLRNVDKRRGNGFPKAYMHNGYLKSLEDVVHFYNTATLKLDPVACPPGTTAAQARANDCWPAAEVDNGLQASALGLLGNLGLTTAEEAALVAYLKTLTDTANVRAPLPLN